MNEIFTWTKKKKICWKIWLFCHLQENLDIDTEKINEYCSNKTTETTEDLIRNKIADKITSEGKSKNKEKEDETSKTEEIYILPEKRQQIIDVLRLF